MRTLTPSITPGEYDIFLNCIDDFTGEVFRSFTTARIPQQR